MALPFLLFLSLFKNKYKNSIPARFWLAKNPTFVPANVHFHAASYGEIQALKPLLNLFKQSAISVITQTGFDAAKAQNKNTRFLPFEIFLPFWLKPSKILVIFEAELWLMLVLCAKLKGARVILINARISDKSANSYARFAFFYRLIFKHIDTTYAQSQKDAKRLKALGAKDVIVTGNIKAAFLPCPSKNYTKNCDRLIVLASTHKNEEELILSNLKLKNGDKLIIAPRHPERFKSVEMLARSFARNQDLRFDKFSTLEEDGKFSPDVILLDTLGELVNIYSIADIVVLGGSFVDGVGGHNPIEAAQFNPSIISGKYIFNQHSLYALVDGIIMAKADEIAGLLASGELGKSSISARADASAIIDDIRRSSGKGL